MYKIEIITSTIDFSSKDQDINTLENDVNEFCEKHDVIEIQTNQSQIHHTNWSVALTYTIIYKE